MAAIKRLLVCASLILTGCAATVIDPGQWFHPGPPDIDPAAVAKLARGGYTSVPVRFAAADGGRASGILLTRPGANAVVLYIGGGDFTPARDAGAIAHNFEATGLDALILQYPAMAGDHTDTALDGARMAALGAYDYLDDQGALAQLPVIVHGFDAGSFIATYVARQRSVAGLVLESAPTSLRDWAHADAPWYARAFSPVKLKKGAHDENNIVAVNGYAGPLLILAGSADASTPPLFARALYRFSLSPRREKMLVTVPGAGHDQVMRAPQARAAYVNFASRIAGVK